MRSQKTKFLVAAVAAALLTTLAVARTVHTPAAPSAQTYGKTYDTHGKVTGTAPRPNAGPHAGGLLACGAEMSETDCEKLQMLLPM